MFSLHCCHKWMGFQTEIIQGKLLSEQNHILQEKCHATIYLSDQCIGVSEVEFITKKCDVPLTDTAARILLRNVAWSTQSNYLSERPLKEWHSLLTLYYKTNIQSIWVFNTGNHVQIILLNYINCVCQTPQVSPNMHFKYFDSIFIYSSITSCNQYYSEVTIIRVSLIRRIF